MEPLSPVLMAFAAATLFVIAAVGLFSGKQVKNADDFDTGGKRSGSLLVAGAIVGTLVGGSSTVGTAQLAFNFGLSAWWFTLGASLGCLWLGFWLSTPLRQKNCATIQGIIRREFGEQAGIVTSILTSIGILLNIVAQILSANALLGTIFGLDPVWCGIITVIIMSAYVLFGGIRGASILGILKLVLLYIGTLTCGICALHQCGGIQGVTDLLTHEQYFNLFARGIGTDAGAGLSACLGVLSTQTYVQAVLSAKTNSAVKKGALISALLTPPVGLLSIFVGYFMRIKYPQTDASQVFPRFVLLQMPPALAGIILAALLVAVVGTGSGMALGFATIFTNDIYKRFICPAADGHRQLLISRLSVLSALLLSLLFTYGNLQSAILTWGFLSMGLRAVVLFLPMCAALFFPGQYSSKCIVGASSCGLLVMILCSLLTLPFDSLLPGLAACAAVTLIGKKRTIS